MTVTEPATLRQLITRSDNHPALVVPESGASLSYAGLQRALDRAAGRLAEIGVSEGDRVALVAANGPALILAFVAVAARGAAAAPLNPALSVAELAAELDDLRVSRLLHDGSATAAEAATVANVPASAFGMRDGLLHVDDAAGTPFHDAGSPEALALLLHTSGTTSKPKTVPIRQRNLIASTGAVAQTYGLSGDDVTMCVMPLFHVHGLVAAVLGTLSTGGTVVIPRLRPSVFWDDIARHGATWYTAVPTIHSRLLTRALELPHKPEHRLRFVRSCSAPLPTVLWRRIRGSDRCPARRGVRHDGGGAPDGVESAAAGRTPPGDGRAVDRHRDRRARRRLAAGGRRRRGRGSGARPVGRRPLPRQPGRDGRLVP